MVNEYKLDTLTVPSSGVGQTSTDLPNHDPLAFLNLEFDMQYDASGAPTLLRNGYPTALIDDFYIKDGANRWIHIKGVDLYIIAWWLMRNAPTQTAVVNSASNTPALMNFSLPIQLNPEQAANLKLVLEWQTLATALLSGGSTTLDSATLNGSVVYSGTRLDNYKIVPILDQVNKTTSFKTKLDTEGRLETLVIISRLNASPYTLSDQITELTLRIEGNVKRNISWTSAQLNWQNRTGDAYTTGVAVIPIPELYSIGNNCYLSGDLGATATDITIYQVFRPEAMKAMPIVPGPGLQTTPGFQPSLKQRRVAPIGLKTRLNRPLFP